MNIKHLPYYLLLIFEKLLEKSKAKKCYSVDSALMLSEAGHWVCCFWASWEDSGAGQCYAAGDWPCTSCLELQSYPHFVAASAGPGCAWKGPRCIPRPAFISPGPGSRSARVPRHPEICLCLPLPAGCLLGLIREKASAALEFMR